MKEGLKLRLRELAGKFRIPKGDIQWKSQATTMSPSEFLSKVMPFSKAGPHSASVEKYRAALQSGEKIRAPQIWVSRIKGARGDHAENFIVTGHEGRHRMVAAESEGVPRVPVEIIAYQEPRFPDRSATLRGSMKMPLLFKPEAKNLSAKLRLREFVRVMGGADIPASMSQIRSVWRTFKNAAPGKIVRSTTQGSSFGPRGMVVQKAASGAKIDREALLAGATNTTNYPITSALHEGGHALFNKAMTGSANQQFLPRLGRGPTPEKHPLRGVQIMANEIGANNSAVQVLRGAGVKQDAVSDFMKFRQRGIDSHMRSARDHVAAAPVGLTPQRHQEIKGAFNRWITDWKRSPASPNAKLSVDAPELVKKDFEAAKLRLRELARGDYAIPALGKMLRDRSLLEEFLTGKRGPKMGDLRHNFNGGITDDRTLARHTHGRKKSIHGYSPVAKDLIVGYGIPDRPFVANARQKGRDAIAKIIRKGRAGGDVYEEINRS